MPLISHIDCCRRAMGLVRAPCSARVRRQVGHVVFGAVRLVEVRLAWHWRSAFVKKLERSTMTLKRCCHTWWNFSLAFCRTLTTLGLLCALGSRYVVRTQEHINKDVFTRIYVLLYVPLLEVGTYSLL